MAIMVVAVYIVLCNCYNEYRSMCMVSHFRSPQYTFSFHLSHISLPRQWVDNATLISWPRKHITLYPASWFVFSTFAHCFYYIWSAHFSRHLFYARTMFSDVAIVLYPDVSTLFVELNKYPTKVLHVSDGQILVLCRLSIRRNWEMESQYNKVKL